MGDVALSDMIIASLLKIWHILPIILFIILFKVFMKKKDNKRRRKQNEENIKNGLTLELRTRKKYEKLGYQVEDIITEQNIDFICCRDEKILLIKCKNNSELKSILEEDIKIFHTNVMKYIKVKDIKQNSVEFRYVIPYSDVLAKSAIKILKDDSYNCKYVVI